MTWGFVPMVGLTVFTDCDSPEAFTMTSLRFPQRIHYLLEHDHRFPRSVSRLVALDRSRSVA
jgi:hypothetical protein